MAPASKESLDFDELPLFLSRNELRILIALQ
jgi:hypothetical protein